ncbi:Venom carboxylesterase-6, partial [Armadillidium nasatum]
MANIKFNLSLCVLFIINIKICFGENEVPLVRVKQGLIRGIQEESLNGKKFFSYMSIPFAEPPVGKLRFRDPVPSKSWDGELDGTKMPVDCLQINILESMAQKQPSLNIVGREDCLHLNVYTSVPNSPEKKLPVMVFIHGGGFVFGAAHQYPPHALMNKDIVFVVIQYRLGIFGFLSTEDSVIPGNMGLKDQQLALKWIKENINAFGGDPDRITIFGESAGGASVNYQILSPGSKGIMNIYIKTKDFFARAIMQSGTSICPWASNKDHRKFAIETGHQFNCSIEIGSEKYLECMQNVNSYYLVIAGSWSRVIEYLEPSVKQIINDKFEEAGPAYFSFRDEEHPLELSKQVLRYYLQREDITLTDEDK